MVGELVAHPASLIEGEKAGGQAFLTPAVGQLKLSWWQKMSMENLIGAAVGSTFGLAGAIVGTYFGIKSAQSPDERRFAVRFAVIGWVSAALLIILPVSLFLAGIVPRWYIWIGTGLLWFTEIPLFLWSKKKLRER